MSPSDSPLRCLYTLQSFGIKVNVDESGFIDIPGGQSYISPGTYEIEPDATAATYPMGLAMLHGVPLEFQGLNLSALQGDIAFVKVLEAMGAKSTVNKISLMPIR